MIGKLRVSTKYTLTNKEKLNAPISTAFTDTNFIFFGVFLMDSLIIIIDCLFFKGECPILSSFTLYLLINYLQSIFSKNNIAFTLKLFFLFFMWV